MRVVIVTGTAPRHKNLCAAIADRFNVVGILHPERPRGAFARARRFVRQAQVHGWQLATMRVLGMASVPGTDARIEAGTASPKRIDFSGGVARYDRLPQSLIHSGVNVHDDRAHDLLRALRPDVTICLGGPIYPPRFIRASPLMLNFHSGIAPIYNGSASIELAFANGHPHLCGGTLMTMSEHVDGGFVLGHYLPAIEDGDSADSLFSKTTRGAATMYTRLLGDIEGRRGNLPRVAQPRPLFMLRAVEFGWYHRVMLARNLQTDIAAQFQRAEAYVEYWREPSEAAAKAAFRATLEQLLWNSNGVRRDSGLAP